MDTQGRHLLVEYHGCDGAVLNDLECIKQVMLDAAKAAKAHVVASVFHPFTPQGVSGVVVIEESHLSIHTWPEKGYAAVDFYTCGDCLPEDADAALRTALNPQRIESMMITRGLNDHDQSASMRVEKHPIEKRTRRQRHRDSQHASLSTDAWPQSTSA